jgi:hypothetical protein
MRDDPFPRGRTISIEKRYTPFPLPFPFPLLWLKNVRTTFNRKVRKGVPRIETNIGLRLSLFNVQGKTYTALDPRLSLSCLFAPNISFKAEYANVQQYIHLLSNNSIFLQTDLWVPVTKNTRPMRSSPNSAKVR